MRFAEAQAIIRAGAIKPKGFRVHFERVEGRFLCGDYFPERGEPLIETESEAWKLAKKFAAASKGQYVNLYVVDEKWGPVENYAKLRIDNR